ncbi:MULTISPECIES: hypothetical protein [Xanthomonas]|uniref:hypothetical protein n=1 Tax=Xanthomonas TaxID=338 RepID=UPI000B09C2F9|nr:hypothetical protein [Xanthomonas euvesicatoria]MBV6872031.1 type IV secretion system protein [Xanthomonas campestris pv. veroniae]MBV6889516.1 type IV secretion system protein [Xanthomonas campestris pv. spermacoces]MCP3034398.1 type IV secretion system protein [Xanthomonas euvesicatoria pv. allii]QTK46145.1 hypothetical protein XeaCFBP3836p_12920 [Xanthomonas euvesicatoria pv. alfalfae]
MSRQLKVGFPKLKARILAMSLYAGLGFTLVPLNAGATGVPVIDVAAIGESIKNMLATVKQWGVEYSQYTAQFELLQKNLVQLQSMINTFGLPTGVKLEPVAPNFGFERCGGGISFSMSSITSMLSSSTGFANSNPREQQKQLCVAIQYMKNQRYNYVVGFLAETMPTMDQSLNKLMSLRNFSTNPGDLGASMYSLNDTNTRMTKTFEQVNNQVKGYDTYIAALEDNQRALTQDMLRGKQSILGTVVKTAALAKALED